MGCQHGAEIARPRGAAKRYKGRAGRLALLFSDVTGRSLPLSAPCFHRTLPEVDHGWYLPQEHRLDCEWAEYVGQHRATLSTVQPLRPVLRAFFYGPEY